MNTKEFIQKYNINIEIVSATTDATDTRYPVTALKLKVLSGEKVLFGDREDGLYAYTLGAGYAEQWASTPHGKAAINKTFAYSASVRIPKDIDMAMDGRNTIFHVGIKHKVMGMFAEYLVQTPEYFADEFLNNLVYEFRDYAQSLETTFEDWACEFGYDTDSRKAFDIFNTLRDRGSDIIRVLGVQTLSECLELEEDY